MWTAGTRLKWLKEWQEHDVSGDDTPDSAWMCCVMASSRWAFHLKKNDAKPSAHLSFTELFHCPFGQDMQPPGLDLPVP